MSATRTLSCMAVLGVLVVAPVLAVEPPEQFPLPPPTDVAKMYVGDTGLRHFEPRLGPEEPGPVELPHPIEVEPLLASTLSGGGPLSKAAGSLPGASFGGALIGPRGGGAIATPRSRADKEIKSLIRLLD